MYTAERNFFQLIKKVFGENTVLLSFITSETLSAKRTKKELNFDK